MAAAPTFASRAAYYAGLWRTVAIRDNLQEALKRAADKIVAHKAQYVEVERATGVPWFWLAIIHMRESNNDFAGVLHNGQKIIGTGRVTTIVPKGRGPFATWADAAIDALTLKGLTKITAWPIERLAYEAERFNGWGYFYHHVNSPYLWGGSNHQQPGKYVRDGVWDPNFKDTQLGALTLLKWLVMSGLVAEPVQFTSEDHEDNGPMSGQINEVTLSVQKHLDALGYHEVGNMDGRWGGKTRGAIAAFMLDRGLPGEPVIDDTLFTAIEEAEEDKWTRPIAPERKNATVNELALKKPAIAQAQTASRWSKITGYWSGVAAITPIAVTKVIDAKTYVDPIKGYFGDSTSLAIAGGSVAAVLVIAFILAKKASGAANSSADASADAYREGRSQ